MIIHVPSSFTSHHLNRCYLHKWFNLKFTRVSLTGDALFLNRSLANISYRKLFHLIHGFYCTTNIFHHSTSCNPLYLSRVAQFTRIPLIIIKCYSRKIWSLLVFDHATLLHFLRITVDNDRYRTKEQLCCTASAWAFSLDGIIVWNVTWRGSKRHECSDVRHTVLRSGL